MSTAASSHLDEEVAVETASVRGALLIDLSRSWGGAQASLLDWFEAAPSSFRKNSRAIVACEEVAECLGALGCTVEQIRVAQWKRSLIGLISLVKDCRNVRRLIAGRVDGMDAVYLNGVRSGLPLVGYSRKSTPRVVLHLRDVRGSRFADRLVAGRSDAIIATTRYQRGRMTPRVGAAVDRMAIIPNGVKAPKRGDRVAVRKHLNVPEDAKVVLLAADYVAWKRHERLLGALALLRDWHGVICGSPRDGKGQRLRRDLEMLSRTLRVDSRVRFAGRMDVGDALAAADVLVSLADDEPFGRTVVEAMQLGVPVVAMKRGGPSELLDGYDGYRLADDDVPYVTAALREAVDLDPDSRNDWSPERCARSILQLMVADEAPSSEGV